MRDENYPNLAGNTTRECLFYCTPNTRIRDPLLTLTIIICWPFAL